MPKHPQHIRLQRSGRAFSLTVDGEEFGYMVAEVSTAMAPEERPQVTLTLWADRVEVLDDVRGTS